MDKMTRRYLWTVVIRCLASGILGISATVILGYAISQTALYQWPGSNAMAIPTAIAFAATALSVFLLTFLLNGRHK